MVRALSNQHCKRCEKAALLGISGEGGALLVEGHHRKDSAEKETSLRSNSPSLLNEKFPDTSNKQ